MQKLVCTQCGAPINPETMVCNYCGSVFLNSQNEITKTESKKKKNQQSNVFVPAIGDQEINNLIKDHLKANSKSSAFLVVFNIFWMVIAANIIVQIFSSTIFGSIMSLFPFVFIAVAVGSILKNIFISTSVKYKTELEAIESGDYNLAFEKFKAREQKKHDLSNLYCMMLIGFYRLEKFDEVRAIIIGMEPKELSNLLHENIDILNIAEALNIRTPKCHDPNCETHIPNHDSHNHESY